MAGGQILQIAEQSIGAERCELRLEGELEGGRLVIYGCSDQVLRIFTVAGLIDAGIVIGSRAEALAELAVVE